VAIDDSNGSVDRDREQQWIDRVNNVAEPVSFSYPGEQHDQDAEKEVADQQGYRRVVHAEANNSDDCGEADIPGDEAVDRL